MFREYSVLGTLLAGAIQACDELVGMRSRGAPSPVPYWHEAAVVLMLVLRILFAIRGLDDGVVIAGALLVLFACAWAVETSRSLGTTLRFRATSAPGLLLGALTLPLLMASRLAQAPESEQARAQFWSSIAASSTLLALQFKQGETDRKFPFAGAITFFAFLVMLQLGFATGLSWCILNAIGSLFLFRSFLEAFPCCTSPGEAMLVAQGLMLYLSNTILVPPVDPVPAIVHTIILGMLLVPLLYKSLLRIMLSLEVIEKKEATLESKESMESLPLICSSIGIVIVWLAPLWMRLMTGVSQHPVVWIVRYLMEEPVERVGLCVYWLLVIGLFSLLLHRMTSKVSRIMIRKGFHVMAVVMFVPALALQPNFLRIAFAVALGVFILVEAIRIWRIPPLGDKIHTFLKAFTDSRDSDVLIISHFSLLLGCAIPVWLSSARRPLAAYAGILSLGIGDTMASVVGYNFGTLRLSRSSKKTWEGTIAGILSIIAASVALAFMPPSQFPPLQQIGSMAFAAVGAGLMEAFTSQLDNAFVPIVYYSLMIL